MSFSWEDIRDCVLCDENGFFYTSKSNRSAILHLNKDQLKEGLTKNCASEIYNPKTIEVNEHQTILIASIVFSLMPILAFVAFQQGGFYFIKEWVGLILSGTYLCFLLFKIASILVNYNKSVDKGLFIVQRIGKDRESKDSKSRKYIIINTKFEVYSFKGNLKSPLFPGSVIRAYTLGSTKLIKKVELINSRSMPTALNSIEVLSLKNDELIRSNIKKYLKFGSSLALSTAFVFVFLLILWFLLADYSVFKYGESYNKILKSSSNIGIGSDKRFERYKLSLDVSFIYEEHRSKSSNYYIRVLDNSGQLLFTIKDKQEGVQENEILNGILTFVIYEEKKTGDILIFKNQDVKLEITN